MVFRKLYIHALQQFHQVICKYSNDTGDNHRRRFCTYTRNLFIILLLIAEGCKAPAVIDTRTKVDQDQDNTKSVRSKTIEDTTTIYHHIIDSVTQMSRIITKKHVEVRDTFSGERKSTTQELERHVDGITPDLAKSILKGLKLASMMAAAAVLGLFIFLLVVVVIIRKK